MVVFETPLSINTLSKSRHKIEVPSIPIPLVNIIVSPGFAPEVKTASFFLTSPSIVPIAIGLEIESVISVCPPIIVTSIFLQASTISSNILDISFELV